MPALGINVFNGAHSTFDTYSTGSIRLACMPQTMLQLRELLLKLRMTITEQKMINHVDGKSKAP